VYGAGLALVLAVWWLGGPLSYLDPSCALGPLQPTLRVLIDASHSMGGPPPSYLPLNTPILNSADLHAGLVGAAIAWGSICVLCLGLAVWRLRPAYQRQLEGVALGKRPIAVAPRPPVGDDPLRWKECFVEGVAPVPILRRVPRRAGILLVFVLSLLLLAPVALWCRYPAGLPWNGGAPAPPESVRARAEAAFLLLGLAAGLCAALVVGVRCSSAVSGEQARQTWDPLLLTGLGLWPILRGKVDGVRAAVWPYSLAFALPTLVVALLHGVPALFWSACTLVLGWQLICFMAGVGIHSSTTTRTAWGSVTATVLGGAMVLGGMILLAVGMTMALGCFLLLLRPVFGAIESLAFLGPSLDEVLGRRFLAVLLAILALLLRFLANDYLRGAERALRTSDPPAAGQ
jgi:hypothetical protein